MREIGRRLERLEELAGGGTAETEAEREERLREIREEAERMNDNLRQEGKAPIFDVGEIGDVVCCRDGRPVTDFHQTLAEEWSRDAGLVAHRIFCGEDQSSSRG